ncbi:MAG: D-aminoacyl-tRNA deacylase [Candidatus Saliniplasma sp.]
MILIISSNQDPASKNILDKLLNYDWEPVSEYQKNLVYRKGEFISATIENHHIYEDDLDKKISAQLGLDFDLVMFISKHASEAGINSLTVHPIGNLGEAKFGGEEGKLVPSAPHLMTYALRRLKENYDKNNEISDYDISFEATHHGPYLETPTFYIEIGSDMERWEDEYAGSVIAKTVLDVEENISKNFPVSICIGGGHYAPRFTDLALDRKISIGHMVPGWGLKYLTKESFKELVKKTPKVKYLYFDRSSTKAKERKRIKQWILEEGLDIRVIRSKDLERL